MTEPFKHVIVTATSSLASSFGQAFRLGMPVVSNYVHGEGIRYNWRVLADAKLVIFTGGADINPSIYGQANKFSSFNPERDTAEIEVLRRCLILTRSLRRMRATSRSRPTASMC